MKDVGRMQQCSRSTQDLMENSAKKTAEMYLRITPPIRMGTFERRDRYTLPHWRSCSSLPIVCSFVHFGALLSQQREYVDANYMATVQNVENHGPLQFLDEHMRASVVDWMIEVSVEFSFVPSVLHSAVQLLDIVLATVPVPRTKFQLLGCVCLLVRSRPSGDSQGMGAGAPGSTAMTVSDVVYMCDSQYAIEEVNAVVTFIENHKRRVEWVPPAVEETEGAVAMVTSDSEEQAISQSPYFSLTDVAGLNTTVAPTTLSFLAPLCSLLRLPLVMYQQLEIDMPLYHHLSQMDSPPRPPPSPTSSEHVVLAIFLSDLSLMDYAMLQFSPFTVACSVVCLTRLTLHHYATGQLLLTPFGVADGRSREVKQLLRSTRRRLYVDRDDGYLDKPFGCVWLEKFILSNTAERRAVRQCIERLWMLHTDYFGHTYYRDKHGFYTPMVLHYHSHMFAGIREKFAARGSNRDVVWQKLQALRGDHLRCSLDRIFGADMSSHMS
eukprot:CAMPEP_0185031488 /NCGR_PEP_ID=MMETSP1103-20130426/18992_1 /TAXON_ID=36769 /ORGANISM="Paraphysomonas bandaiensis, Strain Caron Lab Isolate" /LENGTH=493 /DNA_ID=CAMNT_0027567031 /DNA_START=359 /DNA_END=1840 /DNA_ORIENTATION=+